MRRKGSAIWTGGKEGKGLLSTQTGVLNKTQYSFSSRFAEGTGTNPEELVAAAHSGCFSMKLAIVLEEAGFPPQELATDCIITIDNGVVTKSELTLKAKVPGISKEKFDACTQDAKANCPISKLLNTNITLNASLE